MAHLERLGITRRVRVHPDPLKIATDRRAVGRAWSPMACSRMPSSSATPPASSTSALTALCWVHAERLMPQAGRLQPPPAAGVCADPGAGVVVLRRPEGILPRSHSAQKRSFRPALTGCSPPPPCFATLDRLLARLHANKIELLRAPRNGRISRFTPTARRMTSAAR